MSGMMVSLQCTYSARFRKGSPILSPIIPWLQQCHNSDGRKASVHALGPGPSGTKVKPAEVSIAEGWGGGRSRWGGRLRWWEGRTRWGKQGWEDPCVDWSRERVGDKI